MSPRTRFAPPLRHSATWAFPPPSDRSALPASRRQRGRRRHRLPHHVLLRCQRLRQRAQHACRQFLQRSSPHSRRPPRYARRHPLPHHVLHSCPHYCGRRCRRLRQRASHDCPQLLRTDPHSVAVAAPLRRVLRRPSPLRSYPMVCRSRPHSRALVLTPHAAGCGGAPRAPMTSALLRNRRLSMPCSCWIESMLWRIATTILILLMFLGSGSLEHRKIRPAMLWRIVQSGPWFPGESARIGQTSAFPHPARSTVAARTRHYDTAIPVPISCQAAQRTWHRRPNPQPATSLMQAISCHTRHATPPCAHRSRGSQAVPGGGPPCSQSHPSPSFAHVITVERAETPPPETP